MRMLALVALVALKSLMAQRTLIAQMALGALVAPSGRRTFIRVVSLNEAETKNKKNKS